MCERHATRSSRLATALGAVGHWAITIAGAALGLAAGWFGLVAGLVLGAMVDLARHELRERKRIAVFLRSPQLEAPPEPLPGYAAAACLALRGDWPGSTDSRMRRILWDHLAASILPSGLRSGRQAEALADVASREVHADLPALARRLATEGLPALHEVLARWAFSLAALALPSLEPEAELELRASLGDCGVTAAQIAAGRSAAFPGGRDPWTVLGLTPGASRVEQRRAFRRLSRNLHPDVSPGDGGAAFRELAEAYALLSAARADRQDD